MDLFYKNKHNILNVISRKSFVCMNLVRTFMFFLSGNSSFFEHRARHSLSFSLFLSVSGLLLRCSVPSFLHKSLYNPVRFFLSISPRIKLFVVRISGVVQAQTIHIVRTFIVDLRSILIVNSDVRYGSF